LACSVIVLNNREIVRYFAQDYTVPINRPISEGQLIIRTAAVAVAIGFEELSSGPGGCTDLSVTCIT
jgi:hypothetical protein